MRSRKIKIYKKTIIDILSVIVFLCGKNMKELTIQDQLTDFLLYTSPNWEIKVEVYLQDETLWLSQKNIAELFWVQRPAITKHLKNIFESWELEEKVVCSKMEHTTQHWAIEWKTQDNIVNFYNLDAIISVGYRVNSSQATQFRIWATNTLKEFIIKWFVMDDDRLKNGQYFWKDYFKELLERVRSIRTSERKIYLQITDIFAECSIDYDKGSEITKNFYATVQNKFHFAITEKTAAEIIFDSADRDKDYMWLTTFKNAPDGRVLKSDTTVAKNYLSETDIKKLERTISSYFDYIENQIEQKKEFTMQSLAESVNKFLSFNDFRVLSWNWSISKFQATEKAHNEYDFFNKTQKIHSDFEKSLRLENR